MRVLGLARIAEDDGACRCGESGGDAAGVFGILGGIAAGHAEIALQTPAEERIHAGADGPGEIGCAEEVNGVEAGAGGFERAHDLDGSFTGFGSEEGSVGDLFEVVEDFGKAGTGAFEVEGGELVEHALPLAAGLELDAGVGRGRGPCCGLEEFPDEVGAVGKGPRFAVGEKLRGDALETVDLPQEAACGFDSR